MLHTKKLWNVIVTTPTALAEAFAEALNDGALALSIFAPPRKQSARIEALYDAPPDRPMLTARLAVVAALHRVKPPAIEIRDMPKIDWLAKVAGDFPPLPIARWIIHGAQHRKAVQNRRRALQIDATSAFGTGEHPTTRGCLLMLDWVLKKSPLPRSGRERGPFARAAREWEGEGSPSPAAPRALAPSPASRARVALDLGCGSGILAMAWALATHNRAVAVDLDPESIAVAKNNVRVNGLQSEIKIVLGRGYNSPLVRKNAPYDLIMANIFAGPLCEMAKDLKRHLRPGGTAILSGILDHQANRVLAAHRIQGLHLMKSLRIGEWSVLALRRHTGAK